LPDQFSAGQLSAHLRQRFNRQARGRFRADVEPLRGKPIGASLQRERAEAGMRSWEAHEPADSPPWSRPTVWTACWRECHPMYWPGRTSPRIWPDLWRQRDDAEHEQRCGDQRDPGHAAEYSQHVLPNHPVINTTPGAQTQATGA